jgi:hypothetical protein
VPGSQIEIETGSGQTLLDRTLKASAGSVRFFV